MEKLDRRGRQILCVLLLVGGPFCARPAAGAIIVEPFVLNAPNTTSAVQVLNGLSALAVFTLDTDNPTELVIELTNTSTGVPAGFDSADQLLTAISFDFGHPGFNGDAHITGGTVIIGPGGQSLNFSNVASQLGPGDDVSGEWGYGNMDGTGLLTNLVSATQSQTTDFGGANRDGPPNTDGPQAGISKDPPLVGLGGLGAVTDSVVITLSLDRPISDLDFLHANGVLAEFGSDAAHVTTPEPATALGLVLAGLAGSSRTRRRFR
jgi:hypothetical protein